jgi:DNA-binding phage protein
MPNGMQSFALPSSKTLHGTSAENCTGMTSQKKALPRRKLPADEIPSVVAFRANTKALIDQAREKGLAVSLDKIAEDAGISSRTLKYQLAIDRDDSGNAPTLRTIHSVAGAFGLQAWQVLLPDLSADLLLNPHMSEKLDKIIQKYQRTTDQTRAAIDMLVHTWPEPKSNP